MPVMTTEEVLRIGGLSEAHAARLGLSTDAIVPGVKYDGGGMAGYLRFLEELHRDITPEQWAEIGAAAKAADVADAVEMLERRDALGPCHCGCGARVILEPEQPGSATIAG